MNTESTAEILRCFLHFELYKFPFSNTFTRIHPRISPAMP